MLPGLTHAVTKESFPRRDWSCFLLKDKDFHQRISSACKSSKREAGTSRVKASVSTKIPRQIMRVKGGISFSGKNPNRVVEITVQVAKKPENPGTDIRLRKSHPNKHPPKMPAR